MIRVIQSPIAASRSCAVRAASAYCRAACGRASEAPSAIGVVRACPVWRGFGEVSS